MSSYSSLMDRVVYQAVLSEFRPELVEIKTSYITPQPVFSVRGNSMLDNAYGANPFISDVDCDKFDISPIVLSNKQAQFSEEYDKEYTFSNFGGGAYTEGLELNGGKGQKGIKTAGKPGIGRLPGIGDVTVPREDIGVVYGDDTTAYQRLRLKYSGTIHSVYTEQGKRIKMQMHNKSVSSNRNNLSTVVNGNVDVPTAKFIEVSYNEVEMIFLDHIIVPPNIPKYAVNYLSSEQVMYALGEKMRNGEVSLSFNVVFTGGYLEDKYIECQILDLLEGHRWDSIIPDQIACEVVAIESWQVKDVIAKLPMLTKTADGRILNGYEISAHKLKENVFSFFEELESRNVSVVYDTPLIGTRVFIDSIINSIYGYYDNLRFTPSLESIYVKLYPALYAATSQMFNIGFLNTEFDDYHNTILENIKNGISKVNGVNDKTQLNLYIDTVFKVLHEISGMYSRPTNHKYRTNKILAFLTCGGFGANVRRIAELVAYSGLDVTTVGQNFIDLSLVQLSLIKDKGEGVYNLPVGHCNIKSVICDGMAAEKLIQELRLRSAEASVGLRLNGADSVFYNDTGKTYRLRRDEQGYLAAEQLESNTITPQFSEANEWLKYAEGYVQSLLHNPDYFILNEDFFDTKSHDAFHKFGKGSLRGILWWLFYGQMPEEQFKADSDSYFTFSSISKILLAQPQMTTVLMPEGVGVYSATSTYVKSDIPGFLYAPMGSVIDMRSHGTGAETVMLARRIMDFITDERQNLHSIGVISSLISAAARELNCLEPQKVLELLNERYPYYEFDEDVISQATSLMQCGGDIYGDEFLQDKAKKFTYTMTKFIRDFMLTRNEYMTKEVNIISDPIARGKYEYSGGRLSFLKQGRLYRHGVTGKLMFTNGLMDIEVQDSIKADVACYTKLHGANSIFKPIIKRY